MPHPVISIQTCKDFLITMNYVYSYMTGTAVNWTYGEITDLHPILGWSFM